mgnify:CR=1 FL=1
MTENINQKGFLMTLIQTLKEDEKKLDNVSIIVTLVIVLLIAIWVYFKPF